MSDKKKWESMEQFQVEIDQWRARAELAEARVTELEERSRKDALDGQTTLDVLNNELTKAEARVAELESLLAEAVCWDWEPECPPEELRERIYKALAGRREGA